MIVGLDTALQNSGLVILDKSLKTVWAGKPFEPQDKLRKMFRIVAVVDWVEKVLLSQAMVKDPGKPLNQVIDMVAMEDYPLTGHQKAYETAELLGCLKMFCVINKVNFCLVHPSKTKKYVVKKKEVSKTEIIEYVQKVDPDCLKMVPSKQYSDVADAWVIAQIGAMVHLGEKYRCNVEPAPPIWDNLATREDWEVRWRELLYTDGTGILTKPGLSVPLALMKDL